MATVVGSFGAVGGYGLGEYIADLQTDFDIINDLEAISYEFSAEKGLFNNNNGIMQINIESAWVDIDYTITSLISIGNDMFELVFEFWFGENSQEVEFEVHKSTAEYLNDLLNQVQNNNGFLNDEDG